MLACYVLYKLVFSVIFNSAKAAGVWLIIGMSALMVATVANGSEALWTIAAMIGFLTGMCACVH